MVYFERMFVTETQRKSLFDKTYCFLLLLNEIKTNIVLSIQTLE